MVDIKTAIVIIVSVAVLDGIWISLNLPMYNRMYSSVQGSPMRVNMVGAALSYIFIFVAIAFIVAPRIKESKGTLWDCIKEGGLVGLCIYAIYNFTNLATLTNYSLNVAILDTLWGATLFTLVALILTKI
jgi:uncharacterized membrane protein